MATQTGVVKWFSHLQGYGYIIPDDGGEEVLMRYTVIEGDWFGTLQQGDRVQYVPTQNGRLPLAKTVRSVSINSMQ